LFCNGLLATGSQIERDLTRLATMFGKKAAGQQPGRRGSPGEHRRSAGSLRIHESETDEA
jgi:hypothetical protein